LSLEAISFLIAGRYSSRRRRSASRRRSSGCLKSRYQTDAIIAKWR
jgi:hypothetical protein